MAQDRQWLVDSLRHVGLTKAAEDAERELPEQVSQEEIMKFADRHGISRDEIISRMGGSP